MTAVIRAGPKFESLAQKSNKKKAPNSKLIRVLLDSGLDGDLLFHEKGTDKLFPYMMRHAPKVWHTSNGNFTTSGKGSFELKFFEYSNSKVLSITPDIMKYNGTSKKPAFDLILGAKTLNELNIILNLKNQVITIDEIELPMRNIDQLPTSRKQALDFNISLATNTEPKSTAEATARVVKILDAKYEKADLQAVIKNNCTHLTLEDQRILLDLLKEFEELFDGTLGDWNTKPVSFELKEGAKPYQGRAFPIPQVHKDTIKKEVNRLVELGVLTWQPSSEWASPSFIQPKRMVPYDSFQI